MLIKKLELLTAQMRNYLGLEKPVILKYRAALQATLIALTIVTTLTSHLQIIY